MNGINILGKLQKLIPSPLRCFMCACATYNTICEDCAKSLPQLDGPRCNICDLPFNRDSYTTNASQTCAECLKKPPAFDKAIAAFEYTFPVDKLIQKFKDQKAFHWLKVLTPALIEKVSHEPAPDLICSVPSHWHKTMRRGFNQSEFIARRLAKELQIPYKPLFKKVRKTQSQQGLNRRQRLRNLKSSFTLRQTTSAKHVAIVDDVITTGATAQILARLLKEQKVERISVWSLARTPKYRIPIKP